MLFQLLAVITLGLMCGSELNVAAFGHPSLNRQPLNAHILVLWDIYHWLRTSALIVAFVLLALSLRVA
jgi:hypothetical protein